MEATARLPIDDLLRIREHIARHLNCSDTDELSWLGFWLKVENAVGVDANVSSLTTPQHIAPVRYEEK